MNHKQLEALSDEQLRIKVAEALGWSGIYQGAMNLFGAPPTEDRKKLLDAIIVLHDWPHDLNACHEMEKSIREDQRAIYRAYLLELFCKENGYSNNGWAWVHATARQRCVAFLMTVMEK